MVSGSIQTYDTHASRSRRAARTDGDQSDSARLYAYAAYVL
jgi:hypothetical protein